MKKALILILTVTVIVILTGCYFLKEEKPKKRNDTTIILQDYQGDTLKVYHSVYVLFRTNTGVLFKDQEGKEIHIQGGIITLII